MAGFNKQVVIDALTEHLADATATADENHAERMEEWEQEKHRIQNAKKRLRSNIRDLTAEKITVEELAARLKDAFGGRYNSENWGPPAAKEVPPAPEREQSLREKQFARVIKVVEGSDSDIVTISDLRGLGVLDFVKIPASCR